MTRSGLVVGLACALGACALIRGNDPLVASTATASQTLPVRRIAQFDYGRRAHFGECDEPACPTRTAKTMLSGVAPGVATPSFSTPTVAAARDSSPPAATRERHLTLLFALGGTALSEKQRTQLRTALPEMRHSDRILIEGRTDDLGPDQLNRSLALARGLAVRDYLLALDPQLPPRIVIDARGRCCYVAPNDDERQRARNRRVDLSFPIPNGG